MVAATDFWDIDSIVAARRGEWEAAQGTNDDRDGRPGSKSAEMGPWTLQEMRPPPGGAPMALMVSREI